MHSQNGGPPWCASRVSGLMLSILVVAAAPAQSLPEPALEFARAAAQTLFTEEAELRKLASELTAFDAFANGCKSVRLSEEAAELHGCGRDVLNLQRRLEDGAKKVRDAAMRVAASYRDVAALYTDMAERARAESVRADYLALAKAYQGQSTAAAVRAAALALPQEVQELTQQVEEGDAFLERLTEALAAAPLGRAEVASFGPRLHAQAQRLSALVHAVRNNLAKAGIDVAPRKAGTEPGVVEPRLTPAPARQAISPGSSPSATAWRVMAINLDGTWAALAADPKTLSPGQTLAFGQPDSASVTRLRVVNFDVPTRIFVVRALDGARFHDGDVACLPR